MARKFVAQDNEDCQPLDLFGTARYIINHSNDWQFLFNANSSLIRAVKVLKIAGEFDDDSLDAMRFVAYLYIPATASISKANSCTFSIYRISKPGWAETLIASLTATELANSYWFVDVPSSSLSPVDLDGSSSFMLEVVVTRLSETYRDRVYLNSAGIYGNAVILKNKIDYLDLTKQDE